MNNIEITHSCFVKGEHVEAGTILKNVEASLAAALLVSGRACRAPDNLPEKPSEAPKKKSAKKKAK